MADPFERWNKWAPQFIADLMHDFGLTAEQAKAELEEGAVLTPRFGADSRHGSKRRSGLPTATRRITAICTAS